jgi:hypothetical protein
LFFWEKLQETEKTCTQMFHFNKTNNQLNLVRQYLMTKLPYLIPCSWLITGFVTRLTRRVSLVEQEMLTLSEPLSTPPVCSGVRVTRSLVLHVCFDDRCLSFYTFSFGHCVICSSSIYGVWFPLWYLQTLLALYRKWSVTRINELIFSLLI